MWIIVIIKCVFTFIFANVKKPRLLTLSWRRPLSYRNQSIGLLHKLMDWFLYDNGLRHKRVKTNSNIQRFLLFYLTPLVSRKTKSLFFEKSQVDIVTCLKMHWALFQKLVQRGGGSLNVAPLHSSEIGHYHLNANLAFLFWMIKCGFAWFVTILIRFYRKFSCISCNASSETLQVSVFSTKKKMSRKNPLNSSGSKIVPYSSPPFIGCL